MSVQQNATLLKPSKPNGCYIQPQGLTLRNSAFCPHDMLMCSV